MSVELSTAASGPSLGCQLPVAVLGGATVYTERQLEQAYAIGVELARNKCTVLTGGTSGIPYAAAVGATDVGGSVIGVSPAANEREHTELFRKPASGHSLMLYTGFGNEGRSLVLVRSAPVAIFLGGEAGTLQEFCAAWLAGVPVIAALTGSGGISDRIPDLSASFATQYGSELVVNNDPKELVLMALSLFRTPRAGTCRSPLGERNANREMEALVRVRSKLNANRVDHD